MTPTDLARKYGYCPTCKRHDYLPTHQCPPVFLCADEDGEVLRRVYAKDEEEAAETYSEQYDDDGDGERAEGRIVLVRTEGEPEESARRYFVEMEWEPCYSAVPESDQ